MGFGIIRVQMHNFLKLSHRFIQSAQARKNEAEINAGIDKIWLEANGFFVLF